jgi:hypothetical protein
VAKNAFHDRLSIVVRGMMAPPDVKFLPVKNIWKLWKIHAFCNSNTSFTETFRWLEGEYFEPCHDGYECFLR